MEGLISDLQGLERLEKNEEEELRQIMRELAQDEQNRETVQEIYQEVEELIELNRDIIDLIEMMVEDPENFRRIYAKFNSLMEKHEDIQRDLTLKLEELDIPERQIEILRETDKKMRSLETETVEEIGEKRFKQADKILKKRPTIFFQAKPLRKFISSVRREQLEKGGEVPGVFGFKARDSGFELTKFLELENTDPKYSSFSLDEQVKYILENYGNDRNVIVAHSHPVGDFTHSGTDKDLVKKANNIGVIGVPYDDDIYPVPQTLRGGKWVNLPSKVIEGDNVLVKKELEQSYPEIWKYNRALREAVAKGKEQSWPNYI